MLTTLRLVPVDLGLIRSVSLTDRLGAAYDRGFPYIVQAVNLSSGLYLTHGNGYESGLFFMLILSQPSPDKVVSLSHPGASPGIHAEISQLIST